ncbi:hypothetical protein BH09PLA1_BH09PLA1_36470 [soil metagenome]
MRNWILVADVGRASLFAFSGDARRMQLVRRLENPRGRVRSHDLLSDMKGSCRKPSGRRSAMTSRTDAHWVEAQKFARRLSRILRAGRDDGAYDQLSLVAPPRFLGLLRSELGPGERRRIGVTIPSDRTRLSSTSLLAKIRGALQRSRRQLEQLI